MTTYHERRPAGSGLLKKFFALAVFLVAVCTGATTATAGGWAVASLDEIPEASASGRTTVGFTILQHGVTPVDLLSDPSNDVGISIVDTDGNENYFPAASDGPVGHYVATVELPSSGRAEWSVRMGWFGEQRLGILDLTTEERTSGRPWPPLRIGLVVLTIGLATLALVDTIRTRRRTPLAVS